jgi:hypothetical protein
MLITFTARVRAAIFHALWCPVAQCRAAALNVYLDLGAN